MVFGYYQIDGFQHDFGTQVYDESRHKTNK